MCITVMITYVYAHFPKMIITKTVIVMYMIAVLVLEVHLSSVENPPKNQIVRTVKYGDESLRLADVCPMPTSLNRVCHYPSVAPPTKMFMIAEALSDKCKFWI
jgi:hypothetical protein